MKNRTVIGVICIALALVLCFGIAPLINSVTDGTVEVVKVKENTTIVSGTAITADKIVSAKGKKSDFSNGTYYTYDTFYNKFIDTTSDDYVGTAYAKCELTTGEYISQSKVSSNSISSGSFFDGLEYDQMAISIPIESFANGLSGKIENGDVVSLVVFTSDAGGTIPDELKYVKVITTTTSGGVDKNDLTKKEDGTYSETPSTVTLMVNEQQAKALVLYTNRGNITVALRCRGTSSLAASYLDEQAEILKNIGG